MHGSAEREGIESGGVVGTAAAFPVATSGGGAKLSGTRAVKRRSSNSRNSTTMATASSNTTSAQHQYSSQPITASVKHKMSK